MIVKLTNPVCIEYVRSFQGAILNTEIVEKALCLKLNLKPREYKRVGTRVQNADPDAKAMAVSITDPRLVAYIDRRKKQHGVMQRHTAEAAILYAIDAAAAQGPRK